MAKKYEFERFIGGLSLNRNDIEKRVAIDNSGMIRLVHNYNSKKLKAIEMSAETYENLIAIIPESLTRAGRLAWLLNRLFETEMEM